MEVAAALLEIVKGLFEHKSVQYSTSFCYADVIDDDASTRALKTFRRPLDHPIVMF
jgi:hypothetical protein